MVLLLTSCKKNDTPAYNNQIKGELSVEFDNIAGFVDLQLNSGNYTNASGENFTVTKLKYYVSNFRLTNAEGSVYTIPQDSSYFLIDESDEETHEPLLHIPEGEYTSISFTLGVDSLRSTMDITHRTGVLDPLLSPDMYLNVNSGYIFLNMEGTSQASPNGNFMYHIGGFGGTSLINNLKNITLDLVPRGTPKVKAGKETNIHLMVDVLKIFNGTTNVSIASNPVIMLEPYSTFISGNYAGMIRHDHTEN